MTWLDQRVLVIDTETTGLDPSKDEIIELGVCMFVGREVHTSYSRYLDPGRPIPAEASAIHGIFDSDVKGKPTIAEVGPKFLDYMATADVIAGYNWSFDRRFLAEGMGQPFVQLVAEKPEIDILALVRSDGVRPTTNEAIIRANLRHGEPSRRDGDAGRVIKFWKGSGRHKLTNVYEVLLGASIDGAHTAEADARAAGEVLFHLAEWIEQDDPFDVQYRLLQAAANEKERFDKWLAKQPPKEGT